MFVMVTSTYPLHKQPEVTEAFRKMVESPPIPFVKRLHVLGRADLECGAKTYTILEVEDGKEGEGRRAIGQAMLPYWAIEGFRYSMEIVGDLEAAVRQQA